VLEDGKEMLPCLDGAVACRDVQQSTALVDEISEEWQIVCRTMSAHCKRCGSDVERR